MDLQRVPLFSGLSSDACADLAQRMRTRELPQAVIVREGSADTSAYIVLNGKVTVRRRDADSGVEFLLAELGDGQMFGEMALLTQKPRTATVVAIEPTTCAVLEQPEFERMLAEHPHVAMQMMGFLAARLEDADRHVGVDFVNLSRAKVDPRVLSLLPLPLMNEHHVVPVAFVGNRLTLAMTNPNNIVAFDDVRRLIKGVMIEPAIVSEDDFKRFMTSTYPQLVAKADAPTAANTKRHEATGTPEPPKATLDLLQSDLIRELQLEADTQTAADSKQDLMNASEDAPIVRLPTRYWAWRSSRGRATSISSRWKATSTSGSDSTVSCSCCRSCPSVFSSGSSRG